MVCVKMPVRVHPSTGSGMHGDWAMPLIVSKKEEWIGSISEQQGDWIDIASLQVDLPQEASRWTLQVTASAIVSGMQTRFRIDGQVVNWGFGSGNGPDWEQLQATDLLHGLAPGKHEVALEGSRGMALRRRLVVVAWHEDDEGKPATIKSTVKKAPAKKKTAKKPASKKPATKKAVSKKAANRKSAAKKKTAVKKKSK